MIFDKYGKLFEEVFMKKRENAYLTVYFSLVFGVVLSLLLVLIEGAATGAARAQSELCADLGLDSVFAEYNREILNQYELFFIDSSYGSKSGGIGKTQQHLSDYIAKNIAPDEDVGAFGGITYLRLANPYLEISEVSFASDNSGEVWKSQAVAYMKAIYGGDIIDTVKTHMDTVTSNQMNTRDAAEEIKRQRSDFEKTLADKQITEYDTQTSDGDSYGKLSEIIDNLIDGGLLQCVIPSGRNVSDAGINTNDYYSARVKAGGANSGAGLHEGAPLADGIVNELIYGEYIMKMCGNYLDEKANSRLQYQTEYILYGFNSDKSNLAACISSLFAIRLVGNMIAVQSNVSLKSQAACVSALICAVLLSPELESALTEIILGVCALAESASDIKTLLAGKKVPLIKNESQWRLSLLDVLAFNLKTGNDSDTGLSYQGYLKVLLGLMDKDKKAERSLDIVEMDIRMTEGNENFRIDRCIDYMKVRFGFMDARGYDYVFEKKMCYD